jgi:hypothetical protein
MATEGRGNRDGDLVALVALRQARPRSGRKQIAVPAGGAVRESAASAALLVAARRLPPAPRKARASSSTNRGTTMQTDTKNLRRVALLICAISIVSTFSLRADLARTVPSICEPSTERSTRTDNGATATRASRIDHRSVGPDLKASGPANRTSARLRQRSSRPVGILP